MRLIILLLAISISIFLNGQVIYVSTTGTGTGDSWETACQLQVALNNATVGTQIWVKKGVYKPTQTTDRSQTFNLKNGVQLYGGFNGTETKLTARVPSLYTTVLSGNIGSGDMMDNSYHVVVINSADKNTILDGFTIRDGVASKKFLESIHSGGAGIYINAVATTAMPTISNCIFEDNTATYGAAIFLNGERGNCQPLIKDCFFKTNIGSLDGGAIYNLSKEGICHPTFSNCLFEKNEATYGGAIFNAPNNGRCEIELNNCIFSHNIAYFKGGGIFSDDKQIETKVIDNSCSFENNYPDDQSKITYLSSALLSNGGFKTRH